MHTADMFAKNYKLAFVDVDIILYNQVFEIRQLSNTINKIDLSDLPVINKGIFQIISYSTQLHFDSSESYSKVILKELSYLTVHHLVMILLI
jgi:hypothetical protein